MCIHVSGVEWYMTECKLLWRPGASDPVELSVTGVCGPPERLLGTELQSSRKSSKVLLSVDPSLLTPAPCI